MTIRTPNRLRHAAAAQLQLPKRAEIIRAVRSIENPKRRPGLFDPDTTGAIESFESEILHAAACFTARLSDEAGRTIRFRVDIKPFQAAPGVDYIVEIDDEAHITVSLFRLPLKLVQAPEPFIRPLIFFVIGQAYLDTIARRWPDFDFGVRNPAERFMMDALKIAPEAAASARKAVFN